jgi:PIN domain nuclease of toxin-antitoxin system
MIAAAADTHTAVWYLFHNPKLSAGARQAIEAAFAAGDQVGVSSISLVEMVYLGEKGRISPVAVQDLIRGLLDPEYPLYEITGRCLRRSIPGVNRPRRSSGMPDRIVAATRLRYGVPVISRDGKIRASKVRTIW